MRRSMLCVRVFAFEVAALTLMPGLSVSAEEIQSFQEASQEGDIAPEETVGSDEWMILENNHLLDEEMSDNASFSFGELKPTDNEADETVESFEASANGLQGVSVEEISFWKQFSNKGFYNKLTQHDKQVCDDFENRCLQVLFDKDNRYRSVRFERFDECSNLSNRTAFLLRCIYPQYFFLDYTYYNSMFGDGGIDMDVRFWDGSQRDAAMQEFKQKTQELLDQIDRNSLPADIERQVHDLLVTGVTVEFTDITSKQTSYSAIVERNTVCAGFSQAESMLLNACGVETLMNQDQGHAWAEVNLHGFTYLLDSSLEAANNNTISYERFNFPITWSNWPYKASAKAIYHSPSSPYFDASGYKWFIVNDDSTYGELCATPVSSSGDIASAPDTVLYQNNLYKKILPVTQINVSHVRNFVTRMYQVVLGRDPDEEGLNNWVYQLRIGEKKGADIAVGFFMSSELLNKHLSNADYVELAYRGMMGRASDPGGKADWVEALESGATYNAIVKGFVGSQEFINLCAEYGITPGEVTVTENRDQNVGVTKFVARLYTEALGRGFDVDGLNGWCGQINADPSKANILQISTNGFLHSQEFLNKGLNEEQYVRVMYRTYLGREAEEAGLNGWLERMRNGESRDAVAAGFANSQEFASIMANYGL